MRWLDFYNSLAITHGLAWCFLASALHRLGKIWKDIPSGTSFLLKKKRGAQETRPFIPGRKVENLNPIYWQAARRKFGSVIFYILVVIALSILAVLTIYSDFVDWPA